MEDAGGASQANPNKALAKKELTQLQKTYKEHGFKIIK